MPRFTAVVHDAHGVCLVAAARSQRKLAAQLVDYIGERCDYVLWPCAAANVRELIARDRKYAAIATYFANVGQRWDVERLELLDGNLVRANFASVDESRYDDGARVRFRSPAAERSWRKQLRRECEQLPSWRSIRRVPRHTPEEMRAFSLRFSVRTWIRGLRSRLSPVARPH